MVTVEKPGPHPSVVAREAAKSAVTHEGPTADRYATALERYMEVVTGGEARHDTPPAPDLERAVRTVRDVMTRAVVTAYRGASFKDVARALDRNGIEAVPVIDEDRHVIGVVSASDLLVHLTAAARPVPKGHRLHAHSEGRRKLDALTAEELMTAPAIVTTPTTPLAEAATVAAGARVRSLPVVDESGVLVGMLSRADMIKLYLRSDEAIAADMRRHVVCVPEIGSGGTAHVEVADGVVTLTGRVRTATLASRIGYRTGRIPGVIGVDNRLEFDTDDSGMFSSPDFGGPGR